MTVLARRSGATALVTLLLGALAAGCGSSSHSTTQTHTTAATAVTSVSWDLPEGEPGSLDPALSGTSSSTEPLSNMCEALTRYSASGQLEPWLASCYKQVNPKTLVFTIRSGVKFWDGHAADRRGRRLQPLATAEPAPRRHVDRPVVHGRRVDQADRRKSGDGATSRRPTRCSSRSCRRPPARSARPPM